MDILRETLKSLVVQMQIDAVEAAMEGDPETAAELREYADKLSEAIA